MHSRVPHFGVWTACILDQCLAKLLLFFDPLELLIFVQTSTQLLSMAEIHMLVCRLTVSWTDALHYYFSSLNFDLGMVTLVW